MIDVLLGHCRESSNYFKKLIWKCSCRLKDKLITLNSNIQITSNLYKQCLTFINLITSVIKLNR